MGLLPYQCCELRHRWPPAAISAPTWTVYKVNYQTGAIIWRLGGKDSDFQLGPNVQFAWQHNPIAVDDDTIRIFDNESNGTPVLPYSRVIWVNHDDIAKTATLERSIEHPDALSAASQGNAQGLFNGDTFVGWGSTGRLSDFDPDGDLIFDANVPTGYDTYRAFRGIWISHQNDEPTATAQVDNGVTTIDAIWNGATQVATWTVVQGSQVVATAPWNGLGTAIVVNHPLSFVCVIAYDVYSRKIGQSLPISVSSGAKILH
ncbi:MAG: arylsulfotransferase family protein [Candidatus Binataceae bacterium]